MLAVQWQYQLTDTVSHAVKEDPPLFPMNKAHIVACFYTDDWQQVQFTDISHFWGLGNILNSVVASEFGWMDYMWTAITEVSEATSCTFLRSVLTSTCWALVPGTLLTDKALILKSQKDKIHNYTEWFKTFELKQLTWRLNQICDIKLSSRNDLLVCLVLLSKPRHLDQQLWQCLRRSICCYTWV